MISLQLLQLLLAVPFAALRQHILPEGNLAGLDANIALFGFEFVLYGGFNFIFFPIYYKNVQRVGAPFILSSVWVFLLIGAEEACTHVIPFMRERIDTADPQFMAEKLVFLAIGLVLYAVLTWAALRKSVRLFEQQDL